MGPTLMASYLNELFPKAPTPDTTPGLRFQCMSAGDTDIQSVAHLLPPAVCANMALALASSAVYALCSVCGGWMTVASKALLPLQQGVTLLAGPPSRMCKVRISSHWLCLTSGKLQILT